MTELERLLTSELEKRERAFIGELEKLTTQYESNIEKIEKRYRVLLSDQAQVIDKQRQALERYESISTDWQISIDEEQLQQLQTSHSNLIKRLDALEESDKDLVQQLNGVLAKL